jgi:hypothetical protein
VRREHPWGTQREQIANLMGTHWELEGNTLGTNKKLNFKK